MITRANDRHEEPTGIKTPSGGEMYIISTPMGYYKLDVKGDNGGSRPKICEEHFTNLVYARRAAVAYGVSIEPLMAKKEIMAEGITRRKKEAKED